MSTIYASFPVARDAERAAGALIDQGARPEDISFLANESYRRGEGVVEAVPLPGLEHEAKTGLSTTTPADAAMGAAKGLTVGMGVGILGAIAALTIPGIGIVIGAGALATALTGAAATAVAGAAAGGVIGYLKDQGLSEDEVSHYSQAVTAGGAILALSIPTGNLDLAQGEGIMLKYGASDVSTVNHSGPIGETPAPVLVVEEPVPYREARVDAVVYPETTETNPITGEVENVVQVSDIRPTRIDPISGLATEGLVFDPQLGIEREVRIVNGKVVYLS